MQNNNFRHDINGLRAIAVIAVVLFHFNSSWMPGGFAGVDVFFVISGFLMTGIIFRGIEQENFSILKFYVARANRIIPALAVLCLVLLIFGWFYLTPLEYKALGKHAASSVAFLSNIIYWRESGYFDAASHEKWLLHTWSLSVEWQFYIIYPLVLVAMRKFMSIKTMKFLLLVGTVLGFIFCVIATYKWPNPSYYLLPTRAWEMMLGGIAYLYPLTLSENRKKLFGWTGLGLIIGSYFLISSENPWPGYLAIFPVIGTFLVIQAHRNNSIITNNLVFQKLGTWSYSIYLWHWPIVVAIYIFSLNEFYTYLGVLLSVFLGFLSHQYIERIKFRNDFSNFLLLYKSKPLYLILVTATLSCLIFSYYKLKMKEIPNLEYYQMANRSNGYCFGSPGSGTATEDYLNCKIGSTDKKSTVLLFGDSFAGHFEPMLDLIGKQENISIDSITTNSCYPAFSDKFHSKESHIGYTQCMMNRNYVKENFEKYKVIFVSARWDEFFSDNRDSYNEFINMIDNITDKNITVIYLPNPNIYERNVGNDYISYLLGGKELNSKSFTIRQRSVDYTNNIEEKLSEYADKNKKFIVVKKEKLFQGHMFNSNGEAKPYSSDGGHISVFAAKYLAKNFIKTGEFSAIKELF